MHVGAAYYPEHWPEERWEIDARLMRDAGFTVARMGEFAWCRLEPRRERYRFEWLQRAVSVLGKQGIKTILCTPTAAPPAWLIERHPSILPQGPDKRAKSFGARRHYCVNSSPYQKYTRRIVTAMCDAFHDNPHVIGWQIDNEFGCHDTARCYCDDCANAFRAWLRRRYGTIERLNEEWGTVFWSQEYSQWLQIPLPWDTIHGDNRAHSPSLILDFYRFCSDRYVEYQQFQAEIIKSRCPHHFITHNMMGLFNHIDYYDLAGGLDFASWDNYPGDGRDPIRAALAHDVMRGVKGRPFWVMEQQAGATGWQTNSPAPRPGQIRLWAFQSIARGAEAVVFFRWRTCRFGTEEYWHGVLDHDGAPRRRYQEAAQFAKEIAQLGDALQSAQPANPAAMVLGYDVQWALEIQPHHRAFNFWSHFRSYYDAFYRLGVGVDIVRPGAALDSYKIVVAPTLYLSDPRTQEVLRAYVKAGGTLVSTFRSFVKNPANVVSDKTLPADMDDLFGVLVTEYDAMAGENAVRMVGQDRTYPARVWADVLQLQGAETLAEYAADFYASAPAITVNSYGLGKAYYVGSWLDDAFYLDFLSALLQRAGVAPGKAPEPDVELVTRRSEDAEFLFYLNHKAEAVEIDAPESCVNLLDGQSASGRTRLDPYGVLLLKRPR